MLQVKWYQQVFGSAGSLGEVYSDVLLSLDPNLNTCIDAALKQHIQPLLLLMELKQLSSAFAHNLQSAITSQGKHPSCTVWSGETKALEDEEESMALQISLNKLEMNGIQGISHQTFASYVKNRKQIYSNVSASSSSRDVLCEVTQGCFRLPKRNPMSHNLIILMYYAES